MKKKVKKRVKTNVYDEYKYQNCIIFLCSKYFEPKRFRSKYTKLIDKLSSLGVSVITYSKIKEYKDFRFNDGVFPSVNILYHHLFNGYYYSDDKYSKKKLEKEREILFLLAGKLGVSKINYSVENSDIKIAYTGSSIRAKSDIKLKFNKTIENVDTKTYDEEYSNRGAPVYIVSKNLRQVEENIFRKFRKLNNGVFSYNFYKKSDKLRTFVYKRYNFKIKSLKYETESDNMLEKNFEIKFLLMNYGLGIKFNEYTNTSQKIVYNMSFFPDKDLRIELDHVIRLNEDPFYSVREVYDSLPNKETSIPLIIQYVMNFASNINILLDDAEVTNHKCDDKCHDLDDEEYEKLHPNKKYTDYGEKLNKWIKEHPQNTFEKICENFISTYQIETWLKLNLTLDENESYDSDCTEKYGVIGMNRLKSNNYRRYKNRLLENSDVSDISDDTETEPYGGECEEGDD